MRTLGSILGALWLAPLAHAGDCGPGDVPVPKGSRLDALPAGDLPMAQLQIVAESPSAPSGAVVDLDTEALVPLGGASAELAALVAGVVSDAGSAPATRVVRQDTSGLPYLAVLRSAAQVRVVGVVTRVGVDGLPVARLVWLELPAKATDKAAVRWLNDELGDCR